MSKTYDSLNRAEKEKLERSAGRTSQQNFNSGKITMNQGTALNFLQENIDKSEHLTGFVGSGPSDIQSPRPTSSLFVELVNDVKVVLGSIKDLVQLSQGRFRDLEFEDKFIRTVCEYADGTKSEIDCFFEYLKIRSPIRKENTVHTILEEILKNNEKRFMDRQIRITQKQYARSLPETSVPDEVLRYILNWIVHYCSSSISLIGSIGFLTRLFDIQEAKDQPRHF